MSLILVDKAKCRHDGICTAVCPVGILRMDSGSHMPVPIEGAEQRCINCGHCVAVCPHAALSLATMPVERCAPLNPAWQVTPEQISQLLKSRRSIRLYTKDPVARDILEQIIDAARYSPSGINLQPVCWKIITDPQKVQELARLVIEWMKQLVAANAPLAQMVKMDRITAAWDQGQDRVCRNAPHLIAAYGLKDDMTAPQASTIALTYLELAAASRGLGACWAGYVHIAATMDPAVKKFLHLRSRESCLGAMLIGYPKHPYFRIPARNPAKIQWL